MFVIALATQPSINAKLIFDTGVGNKQRRIDMSKVADYFGPLWCKAVIGFHIFTGKHIGSDNTFEQSYKGLSAKSFSTICGTVYCILSV